MTVGANCCQPRAHLRPHSEKVIRSAIAEAICHTVRKISGPDAKVYDNEFKIALRVGTRPYKYNLAAGQVYYDYHFMRQTDTGQWAEKTWVWRGVGPLECRNDSGYDSLDAMWRTIL